MKLLMPTAIFLIVCLLSLFVGWIGGWDFERKPEAGLWAFFTTIIALFFRVFLLQFRAITQSEH